jgi:hypothetical protein
MVLAKRSAWIFMVTFLVMSGCSSGGGSGSSSAPTVSGVAASGSAISGTIYLRDANGNERSASTSDGTYSFDVTGLTPPFILKAVWSEEGVPMELYSMAVASGTANISPLTQAIVSAAAGGNIEDAFDSPTPSALGAIAGNLPSATSDFRQALGPLILKYVSSADIDPITDAFSPNHQGLDKLLDDTLFTITSDVTSVTSSVSGTLLYEGSTSHLAQGVSSILWDEADGQVAEDPAVAVDSLGNGLVVWSQYDGARYNIQSKWLSGSRTASRVSDGIASGGAPKVVFTPEGVAHAVWYQGTAGSYSTVWHARYVPGTGWTGLTQVSANTAGYAYYPGLAVDGSGNAVAVWYEDGGGVNHFVVYASRFSAQSGTWSAPEMISEDQHSAFLPKVAMNAAGKAAAVWTQDAGEGSDDFEVDGAILDGTTWSAPVKINSISGDDQHIYGQVAVAIDANGDALALWVQGNIMAARMVNGSWSASTAITTCPADNNYGPEVAFVSPGRAVGVWQQQDGITSYVEANSFDSTGGWGLAARVSQGSDGVFYPRLAVDSFGNATVVWLQLTSPDASLMVARYTSGAGWSAPHLLESLSTGLLGLFTPVAAVGTNEAGQSFAVWGLDAM